DKGKSINVFSLNKQDISTIVPAGYIDIANPVFAGEYVLFNGSFSGIENIYAVDMKSKQIWQVTSSRFGSCNADISPDGKKIIYSEYSSAGFSLAETGFDPASWRELSEISDYSPSLYKHLLTEESGILVNESDTNILYQSKPYKKGLHVFNFHSWAPAYVNYMSGENGAGVSFMSQNDLSTATTVVGYKWDVEENTGKATLGFSWQAWYPVIDINTSYGARTAYTDSAQRYNFNEAIISGGLSLPLIFTGGRYYKGIRLQAFSSFFNITNNTSPLEDKLTGTINSINYGFNAYRYIKQSYKDLYPRWGQAITIAFSHSPFGDSPLSKIAAELAKFGSYLWIRNIPNMV
ncbi:MAG: hypothetical protein HGA23_05865, partial [Bacteroidales bacterium]|nr:hypothetical protein [Bacteroidales bacterium]